VIIRALLEHKSTGPYITNCVTALCVRSMTVRSNPHHHPRMLRTKRGSPFWVRSNFYVSNSRISMHADKAALSFCLCQRFLFSLSASLTSGWRTPEVPCTGVRPSATRRWACGTYYLQEQYVQEPNTFNIYLHIGEIKMITQNACFTNMCEQAELIIDNIFVCYLIIVATFTRAPRVSESSNYTPEIVSNKSILSRYTANRQTANLWYWSTCPLCHWPFSHRRKE